MTVTHHNKYFTVVDGLHLPVYGPDKNNPLPQFKAKAQFEEMIDKLDYYKRVEFAGSIWNYGFGLFLSGVAAAVAYVTSNIGILLLEIGLDSIVIPIPVHSLILFGSGLLIALTVGLALYRIYARPYFDKANERWDNSEKYVNHIDLVRFEMHGRFGS